MSRQQHVELSLPHFYQSQKLFYQMIVTMQIHFTILTASFILQETSSLKIIHQSVFVSIISFILLNFINYNRDCSQSSNKELATHPLPFITLVFGALIIFQVPNYSMVVSGICILGLLRNLYVSITKSFHNCSDQAFYYFGQIALSLALLSIEQVIKVDIRYILILPILLAILGFVRQNSWLIIQFKYNMKFNAQIFMSKERFIFLFFQSNIMLLNLIGLLLWNFLDHDWLLPCFEVMISYNLLSLAPILFFFEQILLVTTLPNYEGNQTIFRVSTRSFSEELRYKGLDRKYQKEVLCLICQATATVVMMPCGHLTVCKQCNREYELKNHYCCLLCKSQSFRRRILSHNQKNGYKRRWFIEKKLSKNQYLAT